MSQGGDSIRKLMESIQVKEDWGSSDWYTVISYMDKYIDQHGLSPETIQDAGREAALNWGEYMGHDMRYRDGEQEAIDDCISGWMRMSDRGQALQKMFAPKEPEPEKDYDPADHGIERLGIPQESINEGEVVADYELEIESYPDGEVHVMIKVFGTDQVVCEMDIDNWKALMRQFNKYANRKD